MRDCRLSLAAGAAAAVTGQRPIGTSPLSVRGGRQALTTARTTLANARGAPASGQGRTRRRLCQPGGGPPLTGEPRTAPADHTPHSGRCPRPCQATSPQEIGAPTTKPEPTTQKPATAPQEPETSPEEPRSPTLGSRTPLRPCRPAGAADDPT